MVCLVPACQPGDALPAGGHVSAIRQTEGRSFSDFSSADLRPRWGRYPLGTLRWAPFLPDEKWGKESLRAFPPKYPPWGTRLSLRQAGVRPVSLAVAPSSATTPGPLGSWPYSWVVFTSGRGLPGPLVPLYCPGGFGRGKPLPYTQQRKKFGNVQGLFAPGPRQLGTVAYQDKALAVEEQTHRGAGTLDKMSTPSM